MTINFVPLNIPVPGWNNIDVLEVIGAGMWIALEQHKFLNVSITDVSIMEHAKSTMGDHALEIIPGTDADFEEAMNTALHGFDKVMTVNAKAMEDFTTLITDIKDIMVLAKPGVICLWIREEELPAIGNSDLSIPEQEI